MRTRTDIERRYLAPGVRFTDAQWGYVAAFIALDEVLVSAGGRFGKSFVRAVLLRYLADVDPVADDRARGVEAERLRESPPPKLDREPTEVDLFGPDPSNVHCSACGLSFTPGVGVTVGRNGIEHYRCPPPPPPSFAPDEVYEEWEEAERLRLVTGADEALPAGAPPWSAVCARCGRTGTPASPLRTVWIEEHGPGRIEHVECPPPDAAPPHGIPRPFPTGFAAEAARLDARAGRTAERMPDRVARAVREALGPDTDI